MTKFSGLSNLNKALRVSTAGMQVQNQRLLVISQNIANTGTRATEAGGAAYQRKLISFKNHFDNTLGTEVVKVAEISRDQAPFKVVYSPSDPGANAEGFVNESNVRPMVELADMREASLTHEANLRAYEKTLSMMQESISLLKN